MERWDVYDRAGQPSGRSVRKGTRLGPEEYQLAMEAWFVTEQKAVLIQQRSSLCENAPGMWSVTAGRIQAGETSLEGCLREIREELGLELPPEAPERIHRIVRTDGSQHIWDVYRIRCKAFDVQSLRLQPEEVAQARWVSKAEFKAMHAQGLIFPYPEILEILEEVCA